MRHFDSLAVRHCVAILADGEAHNFDTCSNSQLLRETAIKLKRWLPDAPSNRLLNHHAKLVINVHPSDKYVPPDFSQALTRVKTGFSVDPQSDLVALADEPLVSADLDLGLSRGPTRISNALF